MNIIILEIISSFESPSKTKDLKYQEFLAYVYKTFEDKINSCKVEKLKNKYKKMRVDALKYIVANEKAITTEIFKRK